VSLSLAHRQPMLLKPADSGSRQKATGNPLRNGRDVAVRHKTLVLYVTPSLFASYSQRPGLTQL